MEVHVRRRPHRESSRQCLGPHRIVGPLIQPRQLRLSRTRCGELLAVLVTPEWSTNQRSQSCPHLTTQLTAGTAGQRRQQARRYRIHPLAPLPYGCHESRHRNQLRQQVAPVLSVTGISWATSLSPPSEQPVRSQAGPRPPRYAASPIRCADLPSVCQFHLVPRASGAPLQAPPQKLTAAPLQRLRLCRLACGFAQFTHCRGARGGIRARQGGEHVDPIDLRRHCPGCECCSLMRNQGPDAGAFERTDRRSPAGVERASVMMLAPGGRLGDTH
ncbi:hypothetical protein SUDANB2_04247 [Streptomyces sp. enrichment culture]